MQVRLNKFLSECGFASRRKVEEFILQGRVEVNKQVVLQLAFKVDTDKDIVHIDGELVKQNPKVYFLLNKPKGYVSTTSDEKGRHTVTELIRCKFKVFPVGRLDYNTTGVLILTNDGDFSNLLLHPENKVTRVYRVSLNKPLLDTDKEKLLKAVYIEGKKGKFETIMPTKKTSIVHVSTVEGRNHFVKNMFSTLGYNVVELHRVNYGGIKLDDMPVGAYRPLSIDEVKAIYKKYAR
ncbi:MAG: pseudouridine synthase [Ignavibacteria bacterium]